MFNNRARAGKTARSVPGLYEAASVYRLTTGLSVGLTTISRRRATSGGRQPGLPMRNYSLELARQFYTRVETGSVRKTEQVGQSRQPLEPRLVATCPVSEVCRSRQVGRRLAMLGLSGLECSLSCVSPRSIKASRVNRATRGSHACLYARPDATFGVTGAIRSSRSLGERR